MRHLVALLVLSLSWAGAASPMTAEQAAVDTPLVVLYLASATNWTLAASPYTPAGHIEVLEGANLTVEAGVQVLFGDGAFLIVSGGLRVLGDQGAPANITSPGSWGGMLFNGTRDPGNTIRWAFVTNATIPLHLENSTLSVSNCTVLRSETAVIGSGTVLWLNDTTIGQTTKVLNLTDGSEAMLSGCDLYFDHQAIYLGDSTAYVADTVFYNGTTAVGLHNGSLAEVSGSTFLGQNWSSFDIFYSYLNLTGCAFEDVDHGVMALLSEVNAAGVVMDRTKNDGFRMIASSLRLEDSAMSGGLKGVESLYGDEVILNCTFTGHTWRAYTGYRTDLTARGNHIGKSYGGFECDQSSSVLIENNTIKNFYDKGISIQYQKGSRVINNTLANGSYGIFINEADDILIRHNDFTDMKNAAVDIGNANVGRLPGSVHVADNDFVNCTRGVDISDWNGNVTGNEFVVCGNVVEVYRGSVEVDHNLVTDCTTAVYLRYGTGLVHNNTIAAPEFLNEVEGIVCEGGDLRAVNNTIDGGEYGMVLRDGVEADIIDNVIVHVEMALYFTDSSVELTRNEVVDMRGYLRALRSTVNSTGESSQSGTVHPDNAENNKIEGCYFHATNMTLYTGYGLVFTDSTFIIDNSSIGDTLLLGVKLTSGSSGRLYDCEFFGDFGSTDTSVIQSEESSLTMVRCTIDGGATASERGVLSAIEAHDSVVAIRSCGIEDIFKAGVFNGCDDVDFESLGISGNIYWGLSLTDCTARLEDCYITTIGFTAINTSNGLDIIGTNPDEGSRVTTIINTSIQGFEHVGLYLTDVDANIRSSTIEDCSVGLWLDEAGSMTFTGNTIRYCDLAVLAWNQDIEATITGSNITGNDLDLRMAYNSRVRLLDTTVDGESIEFLYAGNSSVRRSWTVAIEVVDSLGAPVEDAEVNVKDLFGMTSFVGLTDASGMTAPFDVDQDVVRATGVMDLNPHTVKVTHDTLGIGYQDVTFDANRTYTVVISSVDLVLNSLTIDPEYPAPGKPVMFNWTASVLTTQTIPSLDVYLLIDGDYTDKITLTDVTPTPALELGFNRSGMMEGVWNVTVYLDAPNYIPETDETNNELSRTVTVLMRPIPVLNVSADYVEVGEEVRFDGYSSWGPAQVTAYMFDFDDGSGTGWTASAVASHNYTAPGSFYSRLMLKDLHGRTSGWSARIPISVMTATEPDRMPRASFNVTPEQGTVEDSFAFTAWTSDDGYIVDYEWDFGDGYTDDRGGRVVTHSFGDDRVYYVSLTVMDDGGGLSAAYVAPVSVKNIAPRPAFNASATAAVAGESIRFTALTGAGVDPDDAGPLLTYTWDFGDGTNGSGSRVDHIFRIPGTFNVTLTVVDDDGASGEAYMDIAVNGTGSGGGGGGGGGEAGGGGSAGLVAAGLLVVLFSLLLMLMTLRRMQGAAPPGGGPPSRTPAELRRVRVRRVAAGKAIPDEPGGPNIMDPKAGKEPPAQGPEGPAEDAGPEHAGDVSDEEWPEGDGADEEGPEGDGTDEVGPEGDGADEEWPKPGL